MVEFASARGAAHSVGPYERLLFEGEVLVAEPDGIVARHANHQWHLSAGGVYTRLECNAPVAVYFSSTKHIQSRLLGPFKDFSSINGVAYADRQIFAFCDREQGDWYSHVLATHWKTMVVECIAPEPIANSSATKGSATPLRLTGYLGMG